MTYCNEEFGCDCEIPIKVDDCSCGARCLCNEHIKAEVHEWLKHLEELSMSIIEAIQAGDYYASSRRLRLERAKAKYHADMENL